MLNKLAIMGRLVADPELRRTKSGTAVTTMTIACKRDTSADAEKQTDYFDVVAWAANAEFAAKYCKKGQRVIVAGRLQMRDWTSRDGGKRRAIEIIAESFYLIDYADTSEGRRGYAANSEKGDGVKRGSEIDEASCYGVDDEPIF